MIAAYRRIVLNAPAVARVQQLSWDRDADAYEQRTLWLAPKQGGSS